MSSAVRTLVAGIGSPHGDDQAGWLVADRLAVQLNKDNVAVRKATSPAELLDWLDGLDRLIVCDACRGDSDIGQLQRWTWPAPQLTDAAWSGTHDLPLPVVLQLAERLGRLPAEVVVWAVHAAASGPCETTSDEVSESIPKLAQAISKDSTLIFSPLRPFRPLRPIDHARTVTHKSPAQTSRRDPPSARLQARDRSARRDWAVIGRRAAIVSQRV